MPSRRPPVGNAATLSDVRRAETERDFQARIVALAELRGWWCFHNADSRRDQAGRPDLMLLHPEAGRLLFLECKREVGRVTAAQQATIDALDRVSHVRAHVVRPSDWDRIEASL